MFNFTFLVVKLLHTYNVYTTHTQAQMKPYTDSQRYDAIDMRYRLKKLYTLECLGAASPTQSLESYDNTTGQHN